MDWQQNPELQGRMHPQYPSDLQVVVHLGGPHTSSQGFELLWIRITGFEAGVYRGDLLEQPQKLSGLSEGDQIRFLVPSNVRQNPVLVTDAYLSEIPDWEVSGCRGCGSSILLDPPSALIRSAIPGLPPGAFPEAFSALCGLCGGAQPVRRSDTEGFQES